MTIDKVLAGFFDQIKSSLPERALRIVASSMAKNLGHGGIKEVAKTSGISRSTIIRGIQQSSDEAYTQLTTDRQRCSGGGRKSKLEVQPEIKKAIDALIEPYTQGDPMGSLRWTTKSLRNLATELTAQGFPVSHVLVGDILVEMGYTLQSCQKSHEGKGSPDRNAQFEHINDTCKAFMNENQPIISVDAKKKELIGNFKNSGREYQKKGEPLEVNAYDFLSDAVGRAVPYGVYDIGLNEGFVNVGISHDTADFAVSSIDQWWERMGHECYPNAHSLYINADGGGSNGSRCKLWKTRLQEFSNQTGLAIYVSHFPPATSKWNKIEHRLFSAITMNWRGRPLDSFETVVNLIANTTNANHLKVKSALDLRDYATGIKVKDAEMAKLNIMGHSFHPEWNYVIRPYPELED